MQGLFRKNKLIYIYINIYIIDIKTKKNIKKQLFNLVIFTLRLLLLFLDLLVPVAVTVVSVILPIPLSE